MNYEQRLIEIIDNLVKTGSKIENLEELKNESIKLVKKDYSLEDILNEIASNLKEDTSIFLNKKNNFDTSLISGISSCIYLPDFNNNGEYKLKLIGGNKSRNSELKVDSNTMFDIASITKLYTLLLVFKLEEKGIINLNSKISDLNEDIQNLEDFTFNDLIRLHGEIRTNGNITLANNQEEAYNIFKTVYLESNNREENKYTDFGAMVISDTLEKVISKELGKKITFDEIMDMYLFKPLNLNNTKFNPISNNISGNNGSLVHDRKARILGKALGHASIFTTSDDLARLSKEIYSVNYINKKYIDRLGEITFPNSNQSNKGNLGLYVKHPLGYDKTFTPSSFSDGSFSHQGWTGSVALFDPNNFIHNNILVNAIYEDNDKEKVRNDKPVGFANAFDEYEKSLVEKTMLMYVVKKYYNKYCNVNNNINVESFVK